MQYLLLLGSFERYIMCKFSHLIFWVLLSLPLFGFSTFAFAQDNQINGLYLRKNSLATSYLRVFDCGGGKGIRIERSTHKPSQGIVIFCGKQKTKKGWAGAILNLEDNKQYDATIYLSGQNLRIRGCLPKTILCEIQRLKRVQ